MIFRVLIITLLLLAAPLANATYYINKHRPHAVTLWWVIFNNPNECVSNPSRPEKCGEQDVFGKAYLDSVAANEPNPALITPNMAAEIAVLYATGGTTNRRNGRVRLTASIYKSPNLLTFSGNQIIDPLGLGTGWHNADAEIHLVVRDHGRVRREGLITQISNFIEPYCSDPRLLYQSGRNICQDIQFAVFAPGETGQDQVVRFADGRIQSNAAAYLFRQGDAIQAIVETYVRDRRRR